MKRVAQKKKTMHVRRVAKTLLDVLKSHGTINFKRAHEIIYPNQNDSSHTSNVTRDINTPSIMAEFYRLLRMDDKAIARFGPRQLIENLLNDVHQLDLLLQSPDIDLENYNKVMNTKTAKQKLLGSYLGIWNAEKPQEKAESDPDKLWDASKQRFSLS